MKAVRCSFWWALLAIIFVTGITSCQGGKYKSKYEVVNPNDLKLTLAKIDSARVSLVGFEPNEPGYKPMNAPFDKPTQETFDTAAVTWRTFVGLCEKDKFEEAYKFYKEDGNPGDFMVCLKHSTVRYHFYKDVLGPMMYEFEPKDSADVKYLALLKVEYYLGVFMMHCGAGDSDYIPETFPDVTVELGMMLAERNRIDEALEMLDDYAYAVNGLSGNPAFTNCNLALFEASLYYASGNNKQAIETLEGYKQFTSENKDPDKDPAEYDHYFKVIDEGIALYKGER